MSIHLKTTEDFLNETNVRIRVQGKEYQGRVVGTKLKFPLVWVRELDRQIEFSRRAIDGALLKGNVLLGD